ncbi:MAG: HAD hydrolase-like protein, partial [Planctomycetia bacterium]|nr:HAD hydrolase-like protein [Planctomycetia bacterium]
MRKYGAGRKSSVMIGDTPGDVNAGNEIGIRTIGVSWGYATRDYVHAAHPSALADQAYMIADMIRLFK